MTTLPRTATPFDRPVTTGAVVDRREILAPTSRLTRATRRRIVAVIDPVWATDNDDPTDHTRAPRETIERAAELLTARLRPGELISATPDGRLLLQLRREDRAARPVRLQEMAYFALEVLDRLHRADGVVDLGVGWAPITRKQDPEAAARRGRRRRRRVAAPARPAAAAGRRARAARATRASPASPPADRSLRGHRRQHRAAVPGDGRALPARHRRLRPRSTGPSSPRCPSPR